MAEGEGKRIRDVDGNEYVDFNNNFSALIHGHRHPEIHLAAIEQMSRLGAIGAPTAEEVALAETLCTRLPSIERIRFTNSGTEALMMAIKAARAFTGRSRIAKIEGGYHGTYDYAEVSQIADPAVCGPSRSPASYSLAAGAPESVAGEVTVLPLNDTEAANRILEPIAGSLAAILIDPIPSNIAYLQPSPDFLNALAAICRDNGVLLIADEVYSLRLSTSGAQGEWQHKPDLTTLGKIIGGGFPVGAVGGRADVMEVFSTAGGAPKVPHGGTFNAHPVTMAAGLKSIELLTDDAVSHINSLGAALRRGLRGCFRPAGFPLQITGAGSVAAVSFRSSVPKNYRDVRPTRIDNAARQITHRVLLERGYFLAPQLTIVLSTVMDRVDVDHLIEEFGRALEALPADLVEALVQQNWEAK